MPPQFRDKLRRLGGISLCSAFALVCALTREASADETAGVAPAAFRSAAARAQDAETLTALSAEGQVLYQRETVKLDGYHYCSQAVALAERGEFRQSIRAASEALFLGQQGGSEDLTALAERDLAIAYSYAGDLESAERHARAALTHRADNPAQVVGPVHKVLGDVRMRQNRPKEAIESYLAARAASSEKFRPLVELSLANAYAQVGDFAQARATFDAARVPADSPLEPYFQRARALLAFDQGDFPTATKLFQAGADQARGRDAAYHRFWALEGVARSRVAAGSLAEGRAAYDNAIAQLERVRSRFHSEEFKVGLFGDVQQVFERAIVLAADNHDLAHAWDLSERSRSRALLDIVRDRVGPSGTADLARPAALDQVRAALGGRDALVEYHVLPDRTLAWVVRRDGVRAYTLAVGRADLAARVTQFRNSVFALENGARGHATKLYDTLVAPLELRADERLLIVPHDSLHYLPFQALRGGDRYLVESHALAVIPSASLALRIGQAASSAQPNLVAFGNPRPDATYDLPAAEREVKEIARMFRNQKLYLQKDASKRRVQSSAPTSQVLHLATHAELDAVDPLYSRILLAPEDGDSGYLEAHEVYALDLHHSALVTISACESGLGRVARGDEILGFTRSFLSAGASSLIVSLWPVADESTELLMTTLYREIARGSDLMSAMQVAQQTVMANKNFAHPFFWAPFNLIGDGRARLFAAGGKS